MRAVTKTQAVLDSSNSFAGKPKPLLISTANAWDDDAMSIEMQMAVREKIPQAMRDACLIRCKAKVEAESEYRCAVSSQDAIGKLQAMYGPDWGYGVRLTGDTRPTEEIIESVRRQMQDELDCMLIGRVLNPAENDLGPDDPDYEVWKIYSQIWLDAIADRRVDSLDDRMSEDNDLSEAVYFQKQDQIFRELQEASANFRNHLARNERLAVMSRHFVAPQRRGSRKHGRRGAASRSSIKSGDSDGDGDGDGEPHRYRVVPLSSHPPLKFKSLSVSALPTPIHTGVAA